MLKSQDVLVALKLASLAIREKNQNRDAMLQEPGWRGWEEIGTDSEESDGLDRIWPEPAEGGRWTYLDLSAWLKLSASECNAAVKRGMAAGLLRQSRYSSQPVTAGPQLVEFLVHGVKYAFPAVDGRLSRGIPTAFAAPVLSQHLLTASDSIYVWDDPRGSATGLRIEPLHKSVPVAVRQDPMLYELLALLDAIRFGKHRERDLAADLLAKRISKL